MNISLPPELKSFVAQKVKTGLYRSANEVVLTALLRLKDDQSKPRLPELPTSRQDLETELLASVEQLENGKGIAGNESLRRLLVRMEQSARHD